MVLSSHEFMIKMKSRMFFNEQDQKILQDHVTFAQQIASEMAEHFYQFLGRDEEMSAIISKPEGRLARLKTTFIEWFIEMFTGMDNWGNAYADRRWKIGLIHVRVGIGPQHVVPAMATVMREAEKRLQTDNKSEELLASLKKVCMIDLAFIEQAYLEVSADAVLKETGWTEELFKRLVANNFN